MSVPRVNLLRADTSGISDVMAAPWREVEIRDVRPSTSVRLDTDGVEHGVFVMAGRGVATAPEIGAIRIEPGDAIALPHGGYADLLAEDDGLRLLVITMGLA